MHQQHRIDNLYESFFHWTLDKMFAFSNNGDLNSPSPLSQLENRYAEPKVNQLQASLTTYSVLLAPAVICSLQKCTTENKEHNDSNKNAHALYERLVLINYILKL